MDSETVSSNELFASDEPNSKNEVINYNNQVELYSANQWNQDTVKVMLKWLGYLEKDSERDLLEGLQAFQKDYGISISNNLNNTVLQQVKDVFRTSLESNERPDSLRELNKNLNLLGFGTILTPANIGLFMRKKIKAFQSAYDLTETGKVNVETLLKIDELISKSIKVGESHNHLPLLKCCLNILGYGPIRLTKKYGEQAQIAVKKIQRKYKLPVNGMIDERTKTAIYESASLAANKNNNNIIEENIHKILTRIGFSAEIDELNSKVGVASQLINFQKQYGIPATGKLELSSILKIEEILLSPLQLGVRHKNVETLKENLVDLGYGPIKITNKFGKHTVTKVKEFQRDHGLPDSGIADQKTLALIQEKSKYIVRKTYTHINSTLEETFKLHLNKQKQEKIVELQKFLEEKDAVFDPEVLVNSEEGKFQLLDLSRSQSVSLETIKSYFRKKDLLVGQEELILDAAVTHGINEITLVSQVLSEVDQGFMMQNGIPVDRSGRITYIETANEKMPGETSDTYSWVYNFYGIYDGDDNTLDGRAKKAFDEGWHSMQKAILEGAKFVKEIYIGDGKTTYYNKKRDYLTHDANTKDHPLTRNIEWLYEQIQRIQRIYKQLDSYTLYLDIPIYKSK
ncbi:peptidoglycan-binding protein [Oceanobacillus luteolus]|uniref:Peptidoglycan-binding protein n=1 Tax=Oceanobacillus luteolus TaxID=1274358 RepID=A0ABW4HPH7_9BACI